MVLSEQVSHVPKEEGLRWKNAHHLVLMVTPNLLNPHKLTANICHPLREVLHTNHRQYPLEMKEGIEYHVVEHRRFSKLETVDVVRLTTFPKGLIPRVKQLFGRRFYYGHVEYFPQPFELVKRTYVRDGFNEKDYLLKVLEES